jgi:hypothetical protein
MRFGSVGRTVFAGSGADLPGLLRLGAGFAALVAPGALTIDVTLTSLDGAPLAHTRIEGTLANGRVHIERADAATARRPWGRIERYLADPLHALGPRTFPAPDLIVVAADEGDALRLARVGQGQGGARCLARGVEIRCAPGEAEPPLAALRAIARAALLDAPTGE